MRLAHDSEPTDDDQSLRAVDSIHAERRQYMRERYGGFYWGSDFIGFVVAIFFTMIFLGIVGAIIGGVGYQMGAPLPKLGGKVAGTTAQLGIGAAIGFLVAIFLAYLVGGYTAGRMARFDGPKNGLGVVLWTIVVAAILGIIGGILGSKFNVASQLHLKVNHTTLTGAGIASIVIILVVMLIAAALGGRLGAGYHERIDREVRTA